MKKNASRKNRSIKVIIGAAVSVIMMSTAAVLIASADSGAIRDTAAAPVQTEACAETAAPAAAIPEGRYSDANGSLATLTVVNNGDDTAYCEVLGGSVMGKSYVWTFSVKNEGSKLVYRDGTLVLKVYDAEGEYTDSEVLSEHHFGSITVGDNALVWRDSDGTGFNFTAEN
ncbi:MAG: hypothetical protein IKN17_01945 [Ruminococcus sp.]|nr:hypothetical protein [Ruminococcus sp.]